MHHTGSPKSKKERKEKKRHPPSQPRRCGSSRKKINSDRAPHDNKPYMKKGGSTRKKRNTKDAMEGSSQQPSTDKYDTRERDTKDNASPQPAAGEPPEEHYANFVPMKPGAEVNPVQSPPVLTPPSPAISPVVDNGAPPQQPVACGQPEENYANLDIPVGFKPPPPPPSMPPPPPRTPHDRDSNSARRRKSPSRCPGDQNSDRRRKKKNGTERERRHMY